MIWTSDLPPYSDPEIIMRPPGQDTAAMTETYTVTLNAYEMNWLIIGLTQDLRYWQRAGADSGALKELSARIDELEATLK